MFRIWFKPPFVYILKVVNIIKMLKHANTNKLLINKAQQLTVFTAYSSTTDKIGQNTEYCFNVFKKK